MAKQNNASIDTMNQSSGFSMGSLNRYMGQIDWRTVSFSVGFIVLAPYLLRRLSPIFSRMGASDILSRPADVVKRVTDDMGLNMGSMGKQKRDTASDTTSTQIHH